MNITLSEEMINFVKTLKTNLDTQDNRCTANPYYYVVRGIKLITAADNRGSTYCYYDNDNHITIHEDEVDEYCKNNNIELSELEDKFERLELQEIEEDNNVFLTYNAYLEHMKINKHNYKHYSEVSSYIKHAFRNKELESILQLINEIANQL